MLCKRNEYIQIDLKMATKLQHNYINTLSCGRTYAIRIHNYPLKSLDNLNTPLNSLIIPAHAQSS